MRRASNTGNNALPYMRAVFNNEGTYSNVNPTTSNWVDGFIGLGGIHLCCVSNGDGARAELYIGKSQKEENKKVFDFLFAHKDQIAAQTGKNIIWNRANENKASKIYLALDGVNVFEEATWIRMSKFHCESIKTLHNAFMPLLEECYFKSEVIMSIGYASRVIGSEQMTMKSCMLKNATHDRLVTLMEHNFSSLETILDYNVKHEIQLFRISSDIIPFGSSVASAIPWQEQFLQQLISIGDKIKHGNMRVSMHPGQYTVLNSPDSSVVKRSIEDLSYHASFLDSLGVDSTHKIILHIGGVYADKKASLSRFIKHYLELDHAIQQRLVIENDDKSYHIGDVLELSAELGIPVVYDTLHNQINNCDSTKDDVYWISQCRPTWQSRDGKQKIHYSQQDKLKKEGSHSETIAIHDFLDFYTSLEDDKPDIMLEVKDKNLSAIKCIHCTSSQKNIKVLEEAWSRYKYLILEKAPNDYKAIRTLLKDKGAYPALAFYDCIEHALAQETLFGNSMNAALHVWGYFKDVSSNREKERFQKLLQQCNNGDCQIGVVKRYLYRLSQTYQKHYLLQSYYFFL